MAGPSATGNFAQAGLSAQRENERLLKATLENSPDYSKIVQEAAVRKGKEEIASARAEQKVRKAKLDQYTATKTKKEVDSAEMDYKKSKRKAGVLASAGGLLGAGIGGLGPSGRKKREIGVGDDKYNAGTEKLRAGAADLRTQAEAIDVSGKSTNAGSAAASTGDSGSAAPSSSGTNIAPISVTPGSYSGDLSSLSDKDKKDIAFIVSGEAARGTDDIYGVAGVVINRMKSKNYPSSAFDVGHQKGQFEAVEIGSARHEPELVGKLFSDDGMKKLQGALTTLDGRDSFKGQTLLKNRVADEDPMFHGKGNFYHHSWQT